MPTWNNSSYVFNLPSYLSFEIASHFSKADQFMKFEKFKSEMSLENLKINLSKWKQIVKRQSKVLENYEYCFVT